MKNRSKVMTLPAIAAVAALAGTAALAVSESSRRPPLASKLQASPDRRGSADSRGLRELIGQLENTTSDEIRSGQIGRYFTDPAVIITNGQMHHIDWSSIRNGRPADRDQNNLVPQDQGDRGAAAAPDPQDPPDTHAAPQNQDVQIENFETRRIDPRTVVAMYTAVIPGADGNTRQPVVATVVREPGRSGWRVASYTAENAAIPGDAGDAPNQDQLPVR
jgi:hypothetical protein